MPYLHIEPKSKVDHHGLESRHEATHRQLRENLTPEVSTHCVHIVVDLSEEHRSLHWENQVDVIHSTKSIVDAQEEKGSLSVLNSCFVTAQVPVDNQAEEGDEKGGSNLDVTLLRETSLVHERSPH